MTQIRPLWGFTVGYGLSVGVLASLLLWWDETLRSSSSPSPSSDWTSPSRVLAASAALYGFRLAGHLLVRDLGGWKPRKEITMGRWGRVPFAASLSLLYACQTLPILCAVRRPPTSPAGCAAAAWGARTALVAAVLEAVADTHKSQRKRGIGAAPTGTLFSGPINGLYAITRHPNYSAEVLFWTAAFVAGMPSLGPKPVAWIASGMGWYGIVMIMMGSTKRLEENQRRSYGDDKSYQEWIRRVPSPLIPGIHSTAVRGFK
jgi:steroid 5-alpha reductase family enzyme